MGAVAIAEGEEMLVLIHVRVHVLGRVRVLGPVLGRGLGLGLHGITGGVILTSLLGMVEGAEVGSGPVGGVEEVRVLDIVKALGLVLHHVAGLLGLHADGHRVTSVEGTGDAERGRLRILYDPVAHERDLILVHAPVPHALARGLAPCLTLPTRDSVGAEAGVVPVLDL